MFMLNCPSAWLGLLKNLFLICLFVCVFHPFNSKVIYCPLRRTYSSVNTPFPTGIEPRVDAWQSIMLPLRHASSTGDASRRMTSLLTRICYKEAWIYWVFFLIYLIQGDWWLNLLTRMVYQDATICGTHCSLIVSFSSVLRSASCNETNAPNQKLIRCHGASRNETNAPNQKTNQMSWSLP